MVKLLCSTQDTRTLTQMRLFQGNLKKRTTKDVAALCASIINEGLIMPFVIWETPEGDKLLDGHGRYEALIKLALEDPTILSQEFPVLKIEAVTEDDARKALLQISSQYGKITKDGIATFTATIADYKSYSVRNVAPKPTAMKVKHATSVILKIRVPHQYEEAIRETLGKVSYVEVL